MSRLKRDHVHRIVSRRDLYRLAVAAALASPLVVPRFAVATQEEPFDPGLPEEPAPTPTPSLPPLYRPPFGGDPGPSTWYVSQWYGNTVFGYRSRRGLYVEGQGIHFGVDFSAPCGTPVLAIGPGQVIAVDGGYGSPPHNVVVRHPDGNLSLYGHLVERSQDVSYGQEVEAGDVVGRSGDSTARTTCDGNPHLHLEIRKGGRRVATNPVPLIDLNWEAAALGHLPFAIDLTNPRQWQSIYHQPDITFGGPIINDYARAWPP
ncbi:MAG: M23 family metallopeptidase [Chloroflexota bacterium]|nr:M23 family metallopeptidase [Chloroflexota bacterium]